MAIEWNEKLLRDLIVTTKDGDWGKAHPEEGHLLYNIIRGTDFPDVRVGDLSSVPQRYLPEYTVKRRTLETDDILIETAGGTRNRPTGRTLLITENILSLFHGPVTCASFARFLRIDRTKANPRFVFWYLQYLYDKGEMSQHQVQHTGIARFQYTRFAETQNIPLPPLAEQNSIAVVLGTLDDKIELNRRMTGTLEALAQTMFNNWFVDVSATKLPKGWRISRLGEQVEVAKGLSYKGSGLANAGVPLHNLNSIYEGGRYKHEGLKHYTGEYRDRHVIHPGDVIVANTEQGFDHLLIGYPAIVPKRYGKFGLFTHHIYRVRPLPDSQLTNHFIYLLLLSADVREQVIGHTNGTTVNALAKSGIEQATFALPPAERIAEFEQIVAPMFEQQENLYDESRTLAELRDALLPKLLSGELRVPAK